MLLNATIDVQLTMRFNRPVVRIASSQVPLLLALSLSLSLAGTGCARGGEVWMRGGDGSGLDAGQQEERDAGDVVCDPPCEAGETCSAGTCVPSTDADGDGVDSSVDCDDADRTVGTVAERACEGTCGPGLESCEDGVWGACSGPTSCDCEAGTPPRELPCGACGTQRQTCVDGTWRNDGACMGQGACFPEQVDTGGACGNCGTQRRVCTAECTWGAPTCEGAGECAPGSVSDEMRACSGCGGSGVQVRQRTCSDACSWGAWGSYGACSVGSSGECMPGETETERRSCGNCGGGSQTRTRTCNATCGWGAWGLWGTCTGATGCNPGDTRPCASGDRCGVERCSASCTWSSCQPRVTGGCLCNNESPTSGCRAFQCCTPSGGGRGWQFCNPSTCEYNPCASTTSC